MTGSDFKKSTLREYFESIVIAVILALFVRTFVVQAFKIPTGSMENNLLIGDHLLVNKFVFGPDADRRSSAPLLPIGTDQARRRRRLQVSRGARARLHQARHRPAGRDRRAARRRRSTSTASRSTSRTCTSSSRPAIGSCREVTSFDVRERYGPVTVPPDQYLRDGGQPRQLAGQPLLGVPAAAITSRAGRS